MAVVVRDLASSSEYWHWYTAEDVKSRMVQGVRATGVDTTRHAQHFFCYVVDGPLSCVYSVFVRL